jgi:hypothetical protein
MSKEKLTIKFTFLLRVNDLCLCVFFRILNCRRYLDPSEPQILADITTDNFEALSLDNNVNNYTAPPAVTSSQYSRSKSNLDQVYVSRLTKQQENRENIVSNGNKNKVQQQQPQQPQPVTQPQQTLSTPRLCHSRECTKRA